MNGTVIPFRFLAVSLVWLLAGSVIGVLGAIQYLLPEFLQHTFSFHKTRPVHVTLVITWIFHAAAGGIYYYLPAVSRRNLFSDRLANWHFILALSSTLLIIISFLSGRFGGREYLEYPPAIGLLISLSWLFFLINFFRTITGKMKDWPVYTWMWLTGLIFFLFTYTESYLWLFSFFRNDVIRDITVQWKSLGSMVGSWNMMIYGTAFYVMERISGNLKTSRSPITFFFYFLGLTNLLFNWGHHTYIVPAAPWIRTVSYLISMTELLILGSILWNWKKSIRSARQNSHSIPMRFLAAADFWIFLNLVLAIAISVPALNLYTHGTHITVAHAMGATIGINTMILAASLFFILSNGDPGHPFHFTAHLKAGFWLLQAGLFIFWISLLAAGVMKATAMQFNSSEGFADTFNRTIPVFYIFLFSGIMLMLGFFMIFIIPLNRCLKLAVKK